MSSVKSLIEIQDVGLMTQDKEKQANNIPNSPQLRLAKSREQRFRPKNPEAWSVQICNQPKISGQELQSLSHSGCSLNLPSQSSYQVGDSMLITIQLNGDTQLSGHATVRWVNFHEQSESYRLGFEFDDEVYVSCSTRELIFNL